MNTNNIPTETPFPLEENNPTFRSLFRTLFYSNVKMKMKLWEDATFIMADVPLNHDEARRILPWSLWLTKPYKATFFIAGYPRTAFTGAYNESAILFHVRGLFGQGVHCPWMLVNDDTATIYGRELLGYPKKMAEIPFNDDGKKIKASVTRRGTTVFSMEGERISKVADPEPISQVKVFNIGGMGQFFAYNPIWMFKYKEIIHESYTAKITLNIQDSVYDPVLRLIGNYANPIEGRIAKLDILGFKMLWFAGISGLRVFKNSFNLRFR
ncbi:MAG: acetoacetate decarboxylase family protein [Smithella sp.]|nr:acetoacetate decarboxylase family protein [Smithella sp.]